MSGHLEVAGFNCVACGRGSIPRHWMARPIFVNETETEPLQSLANETRPRLIALESHKRDETETQSLANETDSPWVLQTRPRLIAIESRKRDWDWDSYPLSLANKTETKAHSPWVLLARLSLKYLYRCESGVAKVNKNKHGDKWFAKTHVMFVARTSIQGDSKRPSIINLLLLWLYIN